MELSERAAVVAARATSHGRDERDRSEPGELRPIMAPAPAPAKRSAAGHLRPMSLSDHHREPVDRFECPRCHEPVTGEAFYGPCEPCRRSLRAAATVLGAPAPRPATPPPDSGGGVVVLRRTQRRHRPRSTVYRAVTGDVAEVLAGLAAGVERVYLVGARPGLTAAGDRAWYSGGLPDGWAHADAGHYLGGTSPVGRYVDPAGRRVDVYRVAAWLGEGSYSVADATSAMAEVAEVLAPHPMLATPATTGRELLLRTIPERDGGWPCLTAEHQDLIRSTSGQGRWELLPAPAGELHEYDGRFAYAGLCRQLGAGPATLDDRPEWEPYARGRYLVAATVPAGWDGPGVLGAMNDDGGWTFPAEAGRTFETWADGAELHLANRFGWTFEVRRRLLLADSAANPMGAWAQRVQQIRAKCRLPLADGAVRRMLLTTIGTLHGRGHRTTRVVPLRQAHEVPDDAPATVLGDTIAYEVEGGTAWPAMSHPEWTAAIWARGRTRLLSGPGGTGALHLADGTHVVAMRTDAVYVTGRQPEWEQADNGKAGRLTYRGGRTSRRPQPASTAELLTAGRGWK